MGAYEDLTYEAAEGLALITLNRPQALNAFTPAMGQSLAARRETPSSPSRCTTMARERSSMRGRGAGTA